MPLSPASRSLLLAFAAYQMWVVADTLMKLGGTGLPIWQIGLIHSTTTSLLLLGEVVLSRQWQLLQMHNPKLIATRTLFFVANNFCGYFAITHLPLADFYTINFTIPLVTACLAPLLLKEPTPRYAFGALAIGFIGIFIAVRYGITGHDKPLSLIGIAAAIGNVFFFSIGQMILRVGSQQETRTALATYPALTNMLIYGLWGSTSSTPWHIDAAQMASIAGSALCSLIGVFCCIHALRSARRTATVVSFLYTQMITGSLLGWWVFQHQVEPATIGGAVLIIGSGVYLLWRESRSVQVAATRAIAR